MCNYTSRTSWFKKRLSIGGYVKVCHQKEAVGRPLHLGSRRTPPFVPIKDGKVKVYPEVIKRMVGNAIG